MTLTLAIDTSVGVSVALSLGSDLLVERNVTEHAVQGELTAVAVRDALAAAGREPRGLGRIVVGVGPGPFTGLRVGLATGAAMGVALGVPVVGVCSLDAVALEAGGADCVAVSDARRKELYFAHYVNGHGGDPGVATPADLAAKFPGARFVGPAALMYPGDIAGEVVALRAARLVEALDSGRSAPREITPLYLRMPDAVEPGPRKPVAT